MCVSAVFSFFFYGRTHTLIRTHTKTHTPKRLRPVTKRHLCVINEITLGALSTFYSLHPTLAKQWNFCEQWKQILLIFTNEQPMTCHMKRLNWTNFFIIRVTISMEILNAQNKNSITTMTEHIHGPGKFEEISFQFFLSKRHSFVLIVVTFFSLPFLFRFYFVSALFDIFFAVFLLFSILSCLCFNSVHLFNRLSFTLTLYTSTLQDLYSLVRWLWLECCTQLQIYCVSDIIVILLGSSNSKNNNALDFIVVVDKVERYSHAHINSERMRGISKIINIGI